MVRVSWGLVVLLGSVPGGSIKLLLGSMAPHTDRPNIQVINQVLLTMAIMNIMAVVNIMVIIMVINNINNIQPATTSKS